MRNSISIIYIVLGHVVIVEGHVATKDRGETYGLAEEKKHFTEQEFS